jgi:carbon monoxide dehydrogenase subunit G
MDMQGSRTLAVTQQQAWDALNNPEVLKRCIPGCDKFEASGENRYTVGVAIKIGPVSAKFSGTVQLNDIVAPHSYALQFDAQGGVAGFGKGDCKVELRPLDAGCELHYTVHSRIGGKLAQLGQRLIDGAAKSLTEDFFSRFEQVLKDDAAAASTTSEGGAADAAPAPAAAPSTPLWVWVAGALLLAAAVYVLR